MNPKRTSVWALPMRIILAFDVRAIRPDNRSLIWHSYTCPLPDETAVYQVRKVQSNRDVRQRRHVGSQVPGIVRRDRHVGPLPRKHDVRPAIQIHPTQWPKRRCRRRSICRTGK